MVGMDRQPTPQGVSMSPSSLPEPSPGARSARAFTTPNPSPRSLPRFSQTAPTRSVHAPLLPQMGWPKPDVDASPRRPQTASIHDDISSARFLERLNSPRRSPREAPSHHLGRISHAGRTLPSQPDTVAMIVQQKKSFVKMHNKCLQLEKQNAFMGNHIAVLEHETHCLRVSFQQHPSTALFTQFLLPLSPIDRIGQSVRALFAAW